MARTAFGSEQWLPCLGSGAEGSIVSGVYEFLLSWDPDTGKILPFLAERYEVSDDGTTWTFYLRKGVQFHDDWGELTAEDVKFSYELIISEGSTSAAAPYLRKAVKSVEVVNPYQIVFHTNPLPDLMYAVSTSTPWVWIVSKQYVESVGEDQAAAHPIGTGPYRFVEHKVGDYIKFEALDEHWRQVPYFKTLTMKLVPEQATAVAMLRTGEVDIAEISPLAIPELEAAKLRIITHPGSYFLTVFFGGMMVPERPEYDPNLPWVGPDPESALKVRKALALAIDTEAIREELLFDVGEPFAVHFFNPGSPWYDPAWKPYPYDPEEAKRLLAEAGYPGGFDLTVTTFVTTGRPSGPIVAEALTMYYNDIGVRATLERVDWGAFYAQFKTRQMYNLCTWPQGRGDEPIKYLGYCHTNIPFKVFESDELDKHIERIQAELDFDKRAQLQMEAGQYLYDNVLCIPIAVMPSLYGATDEVGIWPRPDSSYPMGYEYIQP